MSSSLIVNAKPTPIPIPMSKPNYDRNNNHILKPIQHFKHYNRNNITTAAADSTIPTNRTTYQHTQSSMYTNVFPSNKNKGKLISISSSNNKLQTSTFGEDTKQEPSFNAYMKLKQKEEKVIKAREHIKSIQQKENETLIRLNELRQIRLKVHQLLSNGQSSICPNFEAKNASYNFATIDFTTSNFYKKRDKQYHSVFRFDKNTHGEAHDRFAMMIDLDEIKRYQKTPDELLQENLTLKEKEYIRNDPAYFFNNNTLTEANTEMLKVKSLVDKLNEEEENDPNKRNMGIKRSVHHIAASTLELTKFLDDPIAVKTKKKKEAKPKTVGPSELDKKKEESIKAQDHYRNKLFKTELNCRKTQGNKDFVNREVGKMESKINLSKKQVILNRISLDTIKKVIQKKEYNPKHDRIRKEYSNINNNSVNGNNTTIDNNNNANSNIYNIVSLDKEDAEELKEQLMQIKGAYKRKGVHRTSIIFIDDNE